MLDDLQKEHQRLVVLRLLSEDAGYDLNESILHDGINMVGLDISRDSLRTQLAWLEEQGLIKLSMVGSIRIAKLTERGLDVANGRAKVPGIKRPSL
ncbi:VpaChn25_0724 family phage protein [Rheinheimera gaetbuli]